MAIHIQCPNKECRKNLALKDEAAGKKVRCPTCKSIFKVPEPEVEEIEEEIEEIDELDEVKPRKRGITEKPQRRRRPEEVDEEEERPRRRKRRRPVEDDYEDEEGYDEDDYDEDDRPRKRRGKPLPELTGMLKGYFITGGVLLLLAVIVPFFPYISITMVKKLGGQELPITSVFQGNGSVSVTATSESGDSKTVNAEMDQGAPQGMLLMILYGMTGLGICVCAGIALFNGQRDSITQQVSMWGGMVGSAASITLVVWMLAWVWKNFTISNEFGSQMDAGFGLQAGFTSISCLPGWGLIVGGLLGIFAAFFLGNVAMQFTKKANVHLAQVIGLVVGILVMFLVVRATNATDFLHGFVQSNRTG